MSARHPIATLFPYTTLFRSAGGEKGFAGDGGPAKDARFDQAYHVALGRDAKNLFVCDLGNRRIRKIDLATGVISTVAGKDRKSTRLNSSHLGISYAVFCLKK